jgi:putative addiction module antidote
MVISVRVRKVGNSLGVLMPKELAEQIHVKEGDELHVTLDADGGLKLTPYDPKFQASMQAFERTRQKYRNALRELAK